MREYDGDILSVTRPDLIALLAHPEWRTNTKRAARSTLATFYRWAYNEGLIERNPAAALPTIRRERSLPRPVPENVYRRALEIAPPEIALAIEIEGTCGLRGGELAKVHVGRDLERDLLGWSLRIIGKGGVERVTRHPPAQARLADPQILRDRSHRRARLPGQRHRPTTELQRLGCRHLPDSSPRRSSPQLRCPGKRVRLQAFYATQRSDHPLVGIQ